MGYASVQAHALLLCVLRVQCEMCALLTACSFESLLSYYTYWYMNVHCSELRWIKDSSITRKWQYPGKKQCLSIWIK